MNRRFKENTMLAQLGWRAAMWGLVLTITMAILAIACGGGNSSSPTAPSGLATAPTPTPTASSIVASLDGQSLVGATDQATAAANQLQPGSRLLPGESLASTSGRYRLLYQSDGNRVLYDDVEEIQLWTTNTAGTGAGQAVMQGDGNFVVYDAQGIATWFTGTGGNANARLRLQDDGNVVVSSSGGQALWDRLSASTPAPTPTPTPTPPRRLTPRSPSRRAACRHAR